jgi:hypothetical protein
MYCNRKRKSCPRVRRDHPRLSKSGRGQRQRDLLQEVCNCPKMSWRWLKQTQTAPERVGTASGARVGPERQELMFRPGLTRDETAKKCLSMVVRKYSR